MTGPPIPSAAVPGGGRLCRVRVMGGRFRGGAEEEEPGFGRRISPLGLRPRCENRRPNPAGCYAALRIRREITVWQVLHFGVEVARHFLQDYFI